MIGEELPFAEGGEKKTDAFIAAIENAFHQFGGVSKRLVDP